MKSKSVRSLYRRLAILVVLLVAFAALPASGYITAERNYTGCGEPYYDEITLCTGDGCDTYQLACARCNEGVACFAVSSRVE
jgi:hypothetical protein